MIEFDQFEISNGLKVFVIPDPSVQIATINILYDVGSRDENEKKTGFAHLFEHLMFGGSVNIESYDEPLQKVGGENNAFTSTDITNYYLTLPSNNLETGFWLESDRMLSLSFDPKVLDVQRNVVIEEFKQRYINQPYGDVWLKLRPLAYTAHPYKWAPIGKDISHIENATMEDVRSFFNSFYSPNNAILVVAGNVETNEVEALTKKWFGPIPTRPRAVRNLPKEPQQIQARLLDHEAAVPQDAIYKTFHMPGRFDPDYYSFDLTSDVLGRGKSSRLYSKLVNERQMFSNIQSYVTGTADPGLLVISGNVNPEYSIEEANEAVEEVISDMKKTPPGEEELEKVKNQAESSVVFAEMDLLNKAMGIAFGASGGNANMINQEPQNIRNVTETDVSNAIDKALNINNGSTLLYRSVK